MKWNESNENNVWNNNMKYEWNNNNNNNEIIIIIIIMK